MGLLRPGDEALHHEDGSHRWTAPPYVEQDVWEASVRAHVDRHRGGESGQARPSKRNATRQPDGR